MSTAGMTAVGSATALSIPSNQLASQHLIEHRIYECKWGNHVNQMNDYFEKALFPAYNRMGIAMVGAFREYGMSDPPKVHVIIPYSSLESYTMANQKLLVDEEFQTAGEEMIKIEQAGNPYSRFQSDLHIAFEGFPEVKSPKNGDRIFELRIYQGYNEDAVRRKVKMFNEEEIDLFNRVNLTPVFFGHGLAGVNLPKLSYMLVFDDMEQRDEAWKDFIEHPDWARMSKLPEYANTVSKIERTFLVPLACSQI